MRRSVSLLAALVLLAGSAVALAEETPPSVGQPNGPAAAPTKTRAEQLDDLFATLHNASSPEVGKTAEESILRLWLSSGSDTVDLLMVWAMRAMEEKQYPLAIDFLDRVIAIKPDYVEGWNKRATVFFLTEDYSKSLEDIGRTLAIEPRHFGALAGLGMIMQNLGDDKRAVEAYKKALDVDPYLEGVKKALDDLEHQTEGSPI